MLVLNSVTGIREGTCPLKRSTAVFSAHNLIGTPRAWFSPVPQVSIGSAKNKIRVVPEPILPSRALPLPVHVMEYASSCSAAALWCASGSIHQICWEGNRFSSCGHAYRPTMSGLDRGTCKCRTIPNSQLRIT